MNSQLTTSMPSASSRRRNRKRSGLVVTLFALCALLVGMGPLASWANEPVNINLASAEVLAEALQGVGLAIAHRIIEYREAHGLLSMWTSWQRFGGSGSLPSRKIVVLFDSSSGSGTLAP